MKGFIVGFIFFCSLLFSSEVNYFMPTDLGSSARMIGQGNIEGFSPHASNLWENPAGLTRVSQWSMSLFRTTLLDEYNYQNIAFSFATRFGHFGVGYYGVAVNDIYTTEENSSQEFDITGRISYQNSVIKVGYANSVTPFLLYGVTLSHYLTDLEPRYGSGTNMDVGLLKLSNNLELSLVVRNILMFSDVTYDNGATENLPLQAVFSSRYDWSKFSFLGQGKYIEGQSGIFKSGSIFYYLPFNKAYVTGAYKEFLSSIDEIQSSFTIGTGLLLGGVNLEYAFETSDYADESQRHYFSIGIHF